MTIGLSSFILSSILRLGKQLKNNGVTFQLCPKVSFSLIIKDIRWCPLWRRISQYYLANVNMQHSLQCSITSIHKGSKRKYKCLSQFGIRFKGSVKRKKIFTKIYSSMILINTNYNFYYYPMHHVPCFFILPLHTPRMMPSHPYFCINLLMH